MNQTIYSGYYTHNQLAPNWAQRALKKQAHWCKQTNRTYKPLNDMSKWAQYYPHPHSWGFGSLIKLLAIEQFIQTEEPTFIWMDMDVHPTPKAYTNPLPPPNTFSYEYEDTPHDKLIKFRQSKKTWGNTTFPYYQLFTGFMILDRPTVYSIWGFINKNHHINTKQWWDNYYNKQMAIDPENPWDYGNDEAILEEWLNKITPILPLNQLPLHIHSCIPLVPNEIPHDSNFLHYHSSTKDQYPDD